MTIQPCLHIFHYYWWQRVLANSSMNYRLADACVKPMNYYFTLASHPTQDHIHALA